MCDGLQVLCHVCNSARFDSSPTLEALTLSAETLLVCDGDKIAWRTSESMQGKGSGIIGVACQENKSN